MIINDYITMITGSVIWMRDAEITVNEDVGSACVVLYRSGALGRTDIVYMSVTPRAIQDVSTAAIPNSDFDDTDFTVNFDQNEDETMACVEVYNDEVEEIGLESFSVRIRRTENRNDGQAASGLPASIDNENRETIVYIRDDDGGFQLSCPNNRVSESISTVTCSVERRGPATNPDTAYISTRNGEAKSTEDYEALSGNSVTFAPNVKSAPITVKIYDDREPEGSEDFFIILAANNQGGDLGQIAATITILDDDNSVKFVRTPGTTALTDAVTVSESAGTVRLTLERNANGLPTGETTVRVSSREINPGDAGIASPADGNGVDHTDVNIDVTFQMGQRRLDIEIEIQDDDQGEPQEAFEVTLSDPRPEANNVIVYPSLVTVYINDDDGGGGDDPAGGDQGGGPGGDGQGTISRPAIVGIGGGAGLLVLIGVLGLVGCVGLSRWNQARASGPRPPVTARRQIRRPQVLPPPSYRVNEPNPAYRMNSYRTPQISSVV
ncbi:extracellular matrix organizing protein FRAS1-like [Amphiura filiformis]|uniref:extracellular matrix organizing protein FRAS1-like n=1 Tax=Amphiura filiformis TaxID=82378 RepID=UPI003B213F17